MNWRQVLPRVNELNKTCGQNYNNLKVIKYYYQKLEIGSGKLESASQIFITNFRIKLHVSVIYCHESIATQTYCMLLFDCLSVHGMRNSEIHYWVKNAIYLLV